jgi:hypothetical protein
MKHRLEHYDAPAEFEGLKIGLARTITIEDKSIAQVMFEDPQSLLYVFRSRDFPETLDAAESWKTFHHGEWAGAIRRQGSLATSPPFAGQMPIWQSSSRRGKLVPRLAPGCTVTVAPSAQIGVAIHNKGTPFSPPASPA